MCCSLFLVLHLSHKHNFTLYSSTFSVEVKEIKRRDLGKLKIEAYFKNKSSKVKTGSTKPKLYVLSFKPKVVIMVITT